MQDYFRAVTEAGFLIERIGEVGADDPADKWSRVPLFLHIRARLDDPVRTGSAA